MPDINMRIFEEARRNQHSIDVEIDASQVASPQQDFPMMLETPNSSNSVLNIVAINELGEQLPTEIEGIANNKNWVHLKDLVQSITNRKMKVFYGGSIGKPVTNSAYGSQAVWNADYVAVYHMNTDPSGTAPQLKDSTSNGNNGTSYGSMTSGDLINGDYGKGIYFDGDGDYFNVPDTNSLDIVDAISIVARIKPTAFSAYQKILSKPHLTNWDPPYAAYALGSSDHVILRGEFMIGDGTDSTQTFDSEMTVDIIYTLENTYDKSYLRMYTNGVAGTTSARTTAIESTAQPLCIGARSTTFVDEEYTGEIYELRLLKMTHSANYISTTHNNLNNPTATGTVPFYKSISKELNFAESLQSLGRAG